MTFSGFVLSFTAHFDELLGRDPRALLIFYLSFRTSVLDRTRNESFDAYNVAMGLVTVFPMRSFFYRTRRVDLDSCQNRFAPIRQAQKEDQERGGGDDRTNYPQRLTFIRLFSFRSSVTP